MHLLKWHFAFIILDIKLIKSGSLLFKKIPYHFVSNQTGNGKKSHCGLSSYTSDSDSEWLVSFALLEERRKACDFTSPERREKESLCFDYSWKYFSVYVRVFQRIAQYREIECLLIYFQAWGCECCVDRRDISWDPNSETRIMVFDVSHQI